MIFPDLIFGKFKLGNFDVWEKSLSQFFCVNRSKLFLFWSDVFDSRPNYFLSSKVSACVHVKVSQVQVAQIQHLSNLRLGNFEGTVVFWGTGVVSFIFSRQLVFDQTSLTLDHIICSLTSRLSACVQAYHAKFPMQSFPDMSFSNSTFEQLRAGKLGGRTCVCVCLSVWILTLFLLIRLC